MPWTSELAFTQEGVYSTPNRPLSGLPVAVLGGGPSLTFEIAAALEQPAPVILTNNAYLLSRTPGILVALDRRWFDWHGAALRPTGHLAVVAIRPGVNIRYKGPIRLMRKERDGLLAKPGHLAGTNSGHAAVTLAIHLGATRVYVAGFDMGFPGGRSHFHAGHPVPASETNYTSRFRPKFEALVSEAKRVGVLVASVTLTMADIPVLPLKEALEDLHEAHRLDYPSAPTALSL